MCVFPNDTLFIYQLYRHLYLIKLIYNIQFFFCSVLGTTQQRILNVIQAQYCGEQVGIYLNTLCMVLTRIFVEAGRIRHNRTQLCQRSFSKI